MSWPAGDQPDHGAAEAGHHQAVDQEVGGGVEGEEHVGHEPGHVTSDTWHVTRRDTYPRVMLHTGNPPSSVLLHLDTNEDMG